MQGAESNVGAWASEVEGGDLLIQAVLGELSGHLEKCNNAAASQDLVRSRASAIGWDTTGICTDLDAPQASR